MLNALSSFVNARFILCVFLSLGSASGFAVEVFSGKIYGRVDVSYHLHDNEANGSEFELESNASRLGFRGASAISDELEVIYQAEYQLQVDDGNDTFDQRNIFAGLKGTWGQVRAGKIDSPLKQIQNGIDVFNDTVVDMKTVLEGENRVSNILEYKSPSFGPSLTATVAIIPGEDASGDDDGPADGISVALRYDSEDIYAAVAIDDDVDEQDIIRLVAKAKFGAFTLGALLQRAEINTDALSEVATTGEPTDLRSCLDDNPSDDIAALINCSLAASVGIATPRFANLTYADGEDEVSSILVSGAFQLNEKIKLKAQLAKSDANISRDDPTLLAVGADYSLAKNTKLYSFLAFIDANEEAQEDSYISVGLQHRF